jgi:phosphate transport system protein
MDMGLERLKNIILDMGKLSEDAVTSALTVYKGNGKASLDNIYQSSERLSFLRNEATDLAVELLTRYQPLADDLRLIKSCIDISYDLARFGRYAYDIALTLDWLGDVTPCDFSIVTNMGDLVKRMMEKSLEAFKKMDKALAETLPKDDDVVDKMYKDYIIDVARNPKIGRGCAITTALIARYLERIGDHACYIADSVIYVIEGEKTGQA